MYLSHINVSLSLSLSPPQSNENLSSGEDKNKRHKTVLSSQAVQSGQWAGSGLQAVVGPPLIKPNEMAGTSFRGFGFKEKPTWWVHDTRMQCLNINSKAPLTLTRL